MNYSNIEKIVQVLSTCSSMKDASKALNVNERTLRKWFKKFNLPHPSTFLDNKINNLIADLELDESDKGLINKLYPDGLNKGLTVDELANKLNKPVNKVSKYIKESKITHSDSPVKLTDFSQKKLNDDIKDYINTVLTKTTNEKITDSLRKDAEKWRNWKKNVQEPLFELLNKKVPQYKVEKREFKESKSKFAAVLALQDYHYGRLSSILETFDATTPAEQEKLLFEALNDIFGKIQGFGEADVCYITVGGDFTNSDNSKLETTKGTPQDSFPSHVALMVGSSFLLVRIVDFALQFFNKVKLIGTRGNHDSDTSVSQYLFLYAWYRNNERVETNGLKFHPRQYTSYCNTLLAFMHGDGGKVKDWPIIIANEASELWGKTKHRVLIQGHYHHRINQDLSGIQRIQTPSMASEDRYSTLQGYQSRKGLSIVLIDSERGYFAEIFANCS